MIWFELKKILNKRLNLIAMAAGYIMLALCIFLPIRKESYNPGAGNEAVSGLEAVRMKRMCAASQTDYITEEFVTATLRQIQDQKMDLNSDRAYVEVIRPSGDLFYFLRRSYEEITPKGYDNNILNDVDLSDESADFYETRLDLIRGHLDKDWSFGNYTETEKAYWMSRAEKITQPFRWGSLAVPKLELLVLAAGFYQLFVIATCISGVFASESESGAFQLLLSTKHGRGRLIAAKAGAAMLFAFGYLLTGQAVCFAVIGMLFGFEDLGLPVQLLETTIPYDLTFGQVCALQALTIWLIAFFVTAFILFVSAGSKSSLAAMAVTLTLLIAPAFFPASKSSDLWNHINYLFAVRFADIKQVLGMFIDYRLGAVCIDYLTMGMTVHAAFGALLLAGLKKVYL